MEKCYFDINFFILSSSTGYLTYDKLVVKEKNNVWEIELYFLDLETEFIL